jgi:hypothetical protein
VRSIELGGNETEFNDTDEDEEVVLPAETVTAFPRTDAGGGGEEAVEEAIVEDVDDEGCEGEVDVDGVRLALCAAAAADRVSRLEAFGQDGSLA